MNQKVIGFLGVAGSGKTTLARCLIGETYKRCGKIDDYTINDDGLTTYGLKKDVALPKIKEYNFAKPLKDAISILFGIPQVSMYENKDEETKVKFTDFIKILPHDIIIDAMSAGKFDKEFMTVRDIMEFFGTGVMRTIDTNIFCKRFKEQVIYDDQDFVVVGDVRLRNEVVAIYELGGAVIKLTRGKEGQQSEGEINSIDTGYVINNDEMTIEESCKSAVEMAEELGFFKEIK